MAAARAGVQPVETLDVWYEANTPAGHGPELHSALRAVATAVKAIAARTARAGLEGLYGAAGTTGGGGDSQKKLDVVANDIMVAQLSACPAVGVAASEEEEAPLALGSGRYAVVFDPLDGSRNIDVAIPTGTIWGIYERPAGASPEAAVLQAGSKLVAAGYGLYSSATMLVLSTGSGVAGLTLDSLLGEWVVTHRSIKIPDRGQIYSLNDARRWEWPDGLRRYIDTIQRGEGEHPKQYSARYVCSLVADVHRTLLTGGWAGNPRPHLRLVYEGNPLAMLLEQAGGSGSDGKRRVLSIAPSALHQRLPLFLGSARDIAELESYGDVQQGAKTYEL
ncbi:hypothetical protein Rsub_02250 [Raphidocelis subcapitata]|uniref:fructose-bisphosphatase n=1 Tax=Raphidocelis subcapitata TaxID=307507 RepID=A0A2V0NS96_9CHLO|nr:hypothetical protein Rsub_02250 [Raphidocelis subcapitata]|eukprot:GBF89532.1 hypothetical protein Rsub_02250 [Raphidocelis subcapitata]